MPYIYQQKGSVIFIRGIKEEDKANWSFMKPIKVSDDGQIAIVIGLEENQVVAMLLKEKDQR